MPSAIRLGLPVGCMLASVLACSSISRNPAASGGAAGASGTGGNVGGTGGAGVGGAAGTPGCVEALEQGAAGATVVDCEGKGISIDLQITDDHCGQCGHTCLDQGCTDGQCQLKPLATVTNGNGAPGVHVIAGGYLYWSVSSEVSRLLLPDGPAEPVVSIPEAGSLIVRSVIVDEPAGRVYVTHQNGVYWAPIGGPATKIVASNNDHDGLAQDSSHVYWYRGATVERWPKGTNGPEEPLVAGSLDVDKMLGLAADDAGVYWVEALKNDAGQPTGETRLKRYAAGTVTTTQLAGVTGLAARGQYLYLPSSGKIQRIRKDRVGTAELEPMARWSSSHSYVKALAFDSDELFWAAGDAYNDYTAEIYATRECQGPVLLRKTEEHSGGLAADNGDPGWLYWTTLSEVAALAK